MWDADETLPSYNGGRGSDRGDNMSGRFVRRAVPRRAASVVLVIGLVVSGLVFVANAPTARAADPAIGPFPPACPAGALSPYRFPGFELYCLIDSPHADLTVTPGTAGAGTALTFEMALTGMPSCTHVFPDSTDPFPCVADVGWIDLPHEYRLINTATNTTYWRDSNGNLCGGCLHVSEFGFYRPFGFLQTDCRF